MSTNTNTSEERFEDVGTIDGLSNIVTAMASGLMIGLVSDEDPVCEKHPELLGDFISQTLSAMNMATALHVCHAFSESIRRHNGDAPSVLLLLAQNATRYKEQYDAFATEAANRLTAIRTLRGESKVVEVPLPGDSKPPKREKPHCGTLEDWCLLPAVPGNDEEQLAWGTFVDHPDEIVRGRYSHTSRVVRIDHANGLLETRNSVYRLGRPAKEVRDLP